MRPLQLRMLKRFDWHLDFFKAISWISIHRNVWNIWNYPGKHPQNSTDSLVNFYFNTIKQLKSIVTLRLKIQLPPQGSELAGRPITTVLLLDEAQNWTETKLGTLYQSHRSVVPMFSWRSMCFPICGRTLNLQSSNTTGYLRACKAPRFVGQRLLIPA